MTLHKHAENSRSENALLLAILATAAVLVLETAGGLWTNSLALLSDAAHVLMDLLSFLITLGAIRLAERPVSDTRTFGWHRIEVFAAFVNGFTVLAIGVVIFVEAVKRFAEPRPILGPEMLAIALLGLAVNVFVIWKLHPHAERDLNVRSAFLHALGDAAASLAVVAGGLVYLKTGNSAADPAAALLVAVIFSWGAWRILRDAVHILLEGAPPELESGEIARSIEEIAGPGSVSDLHVWNLCSHLSALSVHLRLPESRMPEQRVVLDEVRRRLREKFQIVHSTVQIESQQWQSEKGGNNHGQEESQGEEGEKAR